MKFSISSHSLHKHNHDCAFEGLPLLDLVQLPLIKMEKGTGIHPVSPLDHLSSGKSLGFCLGSCCHSCGMGLKVRIYSCFCYQRLNPPDNRTGHHRVMGMHNRQKQLVDLVLLRAPRLSSLKVLL